MKNYELIDTHCHLYLEDFKPDLLGYVQRAREEGVKKIYLPALDRNHYDSMINVETQFPDLCYAMAGIHPCYVNDGYKDELDFLRKKLEERKFAAIGEIGLDYYWERKFDEYQMICFREQVRMAKAYKLPIVIHSRSSMNECIEVVKLERDGLSGIFHCFSGTYENAREIIDCGLYLGIGGVVTYKNAGLAEVVAQIPLENLVLETDAPYLTPVPFRGKRNESSYLKYIVEKIAAVKGVSIEEVANVTTANALKVFGVK